MTALRRSIPDFALANPIYIGARVTYYTVDPATGLSTGTPATLYAGAIGATTALNPQELDGYGKFSTPVFCDVAVIGTVIGRNIDSHSIGPTQITHGTWRDDWATATGYFSGDLVQDGAGNGDVYVVRDDYTSGASLAADLGAGHLDLVIDQTVLAAIPLASGLWGPFTQLASAATVDLASSSTVAVELTGSAGVSSLGTGINRLRVVRTTNALTFTASASLVLPSSPFVSTPGVLFLAASGADGVWRLTATRASSIVSITDFGAVGDGATDNTAAIQAALNSGHGSILVPDGVFCSRALTLASNTLLYGPGTLKASGAFTASTRLLLANAVSNVEIRDITIDVSSSTYPTIDAVQFFGVTNGKVSGANFIHSGQVAFLMGNGCVNCGIENSTIADFLLEAIGGFGALNAGAFVINNKIYNTASASIHMIDMASTDGIVSENYVDAKGSGTFGIFGGVGSRVQITRNTIVNSAHEAIAAFGSNMVVTDNVVAWPNNAGLDYGMSFAPAASSDPAFSGAYIARNTIRQAGKSGLNFGGQASNSVIEDNLIINPNQLAEIINGDGIEIGGYAAVTAVKVRKNTIISNDGKMLHGIEEFTGANTNRYDSNLIIGQSGAAYVIIGAGSKVLFNVTPAGDGNFAGAVLSASPTAGIGYATGAGGTVTQASSKSTGVTLNKAAGAITMNNAALAAGTIVSFVLTDSAIAATDVLVLNHISGGTVGSYHLNAQAAAGSATINLRNNTAGSLSEALVIQFAVIKGVNS